MSLARIARVSLIVHILQNIPYCNRKLCVFIYFPQQKILILFSWIRTCHVEHIPALVVM